MLTFRELQKELGITQRLLTRLIGEGLPFTLEKRSKRFDREAVDQWLVANGYAEVETPERAERAHGQVVQTYQQLAEALAMTGRDPVRQLARWAALPGFPGKPGTQGRRDGYFPVDQIRLWIAARTGETHDAELTELRLERERLRLEREIRDELLAAERLADVDEVARHNARCVANAKAVLEPMADAVVGILPAKAPAAKQWPQVLREVHGAVQRLLDDAYAEIEGLIEGDTDEVEDEHSHS